MAKISTISPIEFKAAKSLATIFSCRMLGLFMILPVFALYVDKLPGATPALVGIALGIYGLTQAVLQIPFGMISDRLGRKPVIAAGLLLFIAGSLFAAMATTMHGIIIGRAIQGAGAIGSTTLALLSDLTKVENRTKAMAVIGMTIGLSFVLAMMLGPIINNFMGLSGIFWITAVLGVMGLLILYLQVPTPPISIFHRDTEPVPVLFKSVLTNGKLLSLDFGIFVSHAILTASFIAIPLALTKAGLGETHQWYLYVPVLILAFIAMLPLIIIGEKKRQMKPILLLSIALIMLTQLLLWLFNQSLVIVTIMLFLFFTGFTLLEASLPSLVSKIAPAGSKGTAMGVYSSAQFFGIFVGGSVGGILYGEYHNGLFLACGLLALLWLIIAAIGSKPPYLSTFMLETGKISPEQARSLTERLEASPGVAEALVLIDDGVAYLKIDNKIAAQEELHRIRDEALGKIVYNS